MKVKKILSIFLLLSIVLPFIFIPVNADDVVYPATFVALGDSIAYGETLDSKVEQRYSTLVGKQIGVEVINYGVNGMTSDGLILALNTGAYDEALAHASYVSVSIGSNDLLSPFMNLAMSAMEGLSMSVDSINDLSNLLSNNSGLSNMLTALNEELTENETLLKACDAFRAKLTTIVGIISKKAPYAEIYFNNIYNPYAKITVTNPLTNEPLIDLDGLSEYYISRINSYFDTKSYSYTLIDLYTAFSDGGLTNARVNLLDISTISFDPHPTAAGHQVIADTILNQIGVMPHPIDIEDHWGKSYIMAMIHRGLFTNVIGDKFNPDSPMTRGMFVTILGRLFDVDLTYYIPPAFSDVAKTDYYCLYVSWASYNNLVLGTGDNKFEPNKSITREEMAVIIERCISLYNLSLPISITADSTFSDIDSVSSWAVSAISLMKNTGLLKGDTDNNINPQTTITNAEAVTILYRFDDAMKQ